MPAPTQSFGVAVTLNYKALSLGCLFEVYVDDRGQQSDRMWARSLLLELQSDCCVWFFSPFPRAGVAME